MIEVSLLTTNEGVPLFHQVVRFMEHEGFLLYDVCSFFRHPSDNVLYRMDVIFVRRESRLLADYMLTF